MARIPIPFIGGGDLGKRRPAETKLAPPFFSGEAEEGVSVGEADATPSGEVTVPPEPVEPAHVLAEAELEVEPAETLSPAAEVEGEPDTGEPWPGSGTRPEAEAAVEEGEAEVTEEGALAEEDALDEGGEGSPPYTPLEAAADLWGEDTGPESTLPASEAELEAPAPERELVADISEPEPQLEEGPEAEPQAAAMSEPEYAGEVEAEEEGLELPDFLLGADGAYEEPVERKAEIGEESRDEGDELTRVASDLLGGDHAARIRDLIEKLRSEEADLAIPRAFAAGFIAAREGKKEPE